MSGEITHSELLGAFLVILGLVLTFVYKRTGQSIAHSDKIADDLNKLLSSDHVHREEFEALLEHVNRIREKQIQIETRLDLHVERHLKLKERELP